MAKGLLGGVAAEQALGQGQFGFRAGWLTVEAGLACLNVAELGQGQGQLVPLEGAGWGRLALASLAELRAGSGPAQAMAGQVQGPIAPGWGRGACFQGRRQGGRVGGEALEQQLAQPGLVAPQGVEPIGGGRCLGEAAQQLPPELLRRWGIA